MLTLEQARTLVRLSGGRVLPPVGSVVDVHQFVGGGETTKTDEGGVFTRLLMRYGQGLETLIDVFHCSPDDQGRPRFILLPVQLPDPCPPPDGWPRWRLSP